MHMSEGTLSDTASHIITNTVIKFQWQSEADRRSSSQHFVCFLSTIPSINLLFFLSYHKYSFSLSLVKWVYQTESAFSSFVFCISKGYFVIVLRYGTNIILPDFWTHTLHAKMSFAEGAVWGHEICFWGTTGLICLLMVHNARKRALMQFTDNEGPYQPAQMRRLIWAIVVRLQYQWIL